MLNEEIKQQINFYLKQDLGGGDITSSLLKSREVRGTIFANQKCILAGIEESNFLFEQAGLKVRIIRKDKEFVEKGSKIMIVEGNNKKMLERERLALNIIGRMSGIAMLCNEAQEKSETRLAVTRKTVPGFQALDKKAASLVGVWSHRKDLSDFILLKENHLMNFSSIKTAIREAKQKGKVEIETETREQAMEAAEEKPWMIMLDNFKPEEAKKTIRELRKKGYDGKIELSGGITIKNLKKYDKLGADLISMGQLTKEAKMLDFSMRIGK